MKKTIIYFVVLMILANSLSADVISTIEQLDGLAEFSFSIISDNKGFSAYGKDTLTDERRISMGKCEDWIVANDEFCLGAGDHFGAARVDQIAPMQEDPFWHNHFYPNIGDNDLTIPINPATEEHEKGGVSGEQWEWGRGWVIFKHMNNFFNRNTAVDRIEFRQPEASPVMSYTSATDHTLIPYDDQLIDYYVERTQGNFTIHIISVFFPDHCVFAERSKNFMINKLTNLAATKTDHDIVTAIP